MGEFLPWKLILSGGEAERAESSLGHSTLSPGKSGVYKLLDRLLVTREPWPQVCVGNRPPWAIEMVALAEGGFPVLPQPRKIDAIILGVWEERTRKVSLVIYRGRDLGCVTVTDSRSSGEKKGLVWGPALCGPTLGEVLCGAQQQGGRGWLS